MADSTSHKAQKVDNIHKYSSNMINRTTSESIRLGDSDKIHNHPTSLPAASVTPKKKTSFQITSVIVGGHPSNDGGDDSADDLDESHAEDISEIIDTSRATDIENETPSYSEDTFSKDDVFFNSSTSLGSAPVIPTSSQYGLAIVSTPEGCTNILNSNTSVGNNSTSNDLHNNTENVINLGIVGTKHLEGEMRDLNSHTARNERFKVVKIESTEPFKRGRWMCMDFLDHTMSQQQQQLQSQGSVINNSDCKVVESSDFTALNVNQCPGTDSGISMSDHPTISSLVEDQAHVEHSVSLNSNNMLQEQQNFIPQISSQSSVSPGQTIQFGTQSGIMIQNVINASQSQVLQQQAQSLTSIGSQHTILGSNQHQSLQPQQIQQVISTTNMHSQQTLVNQQISQTNTQIQQSNQQMQQPNHQIHQSSQQLQQPIQQANQQIQQPNQHIQPSNQQLQQPNPQIQPPNQHIQQSNQPMQQPSQQIQQANQQMQQQNQQMQQQNQQMQQQNQQMQQQSQQMQQQNQQMQQQNQQMQQSNPQFQQPNQQMQHQSLPVQHVHQIHQSQTGNIVPQQYQQSQIQQIHQQANLQAVQQNTQGMLQQQPTIPPQHMQHQQMSTISVQQQINQGQMSVQIPQTVHPNQNIQQIQQQAAQLPVHSQMQGSAQHIQHVDVQHMTMSGVVGTSSQVHATQTSQQQQYHHHPTSQPIMQPGIQTQPNLMSVPSQYFGNTQITGTNMNVQSIPNSVLQSQTQSNANLNLQQSYPVNTLNQQQPHQISMTHVIPPATNIPHIPQPSIPTSGVAVMMSQPGPLPVVNNLTLPSAQSTVLSPQAPSQGSTLVQQQYLSQPVVSSVVCSQASAGLQSYVTSTVNVVPSSVVDNVPVYNNEASTDQAVIPPIQHIELSVDGTGVEEPQVEDPESSSATSAVAIDNKIEQAMDLVKSHLMYAVREEVEVLKERIAELMEKITQLETENTMLKANASQETLAQLSSSLQPPP